MTEMARRNDWPERLITAIEGAHGRPFSWGEHDCALFAANTVQAMTGQDFAVPFRGRYRTRLGALRKLYPFGGLEAYVDTLGLAEIRPAFARRGDLALIDTEDGPALGICTGRTVTYPALDGLLARPVRDARRCWRI